MARRNRQDLQNAQALWRLHRDAPEAEPAPESKEKRVVIRRRAGETETRTVLKKAA